MRRVFYGKCDVCRVAFVSLGMWRVACGASDVWGVAKCGVNMCSACSEWRSITCGVCGAWTCGVWRVDVWRVEVWRVAHSSAFGWYRFPMAASVRASRYHATIRA